MAAVLVVALGACAPTPPEGVAFTRVDLPAGTVPQTVTAAGDDVLVGVRRDESPGLVKEGGGEIALHGTTPYALAANWYAVTVDGDRLLAVGGERGGAHGNVRWSVWTGTGDELTEQPQGFSVFGGWGAGELVDAVFTADGPVLVGSWQSDAAGLDIATWTTDGTTWTRQSSTGTALASTAVSPGFATSATAFGKGALVAGWRLDGGQRPVVWTSGSGARDWTATALPDAGKSGGAVAARCAGETCLVSGWVDGALALWRLDGGTWSRIPGVPSVPVADDAPLPAPVEVGGRLVQVASDDDRVVLLTRDGDQWTRRDARGPAGQVVDAVVAGGALHVLTRSEVWRVDTGSLG